MTVNATAPVTVAGPAGHIYLVGMPGAGKTTIGRQLAKRLGRPFVDVDHEIEARTGVRIPLIFEYEGEAGFRARETQVLKELSESAAMVIATGGGAVLREENRSVMRATGMTIYLCVSPELLHERTRHDQNRPLLQVADPLAKLQSLFAERDPFYRELADMTVHGGTGHATSVVRRIEKELESRCAA